MSLEQYRELERQRVQIRHDHHDQDSPEEDDLLDQMDGVWLGLTDKEQAELGQEEQREGADSGAGSQETASTLRAELVQMRDELAGWYGKVRKVLESAKTLGEFREMVSTLGLNWSMARSPVIELYNDRLTRYVKRRGKVLQDLDDQVNLDETLRIVLDAAPDMSLHAPKVMGNRVLNALKEAGIMTVKDLVHYSNQDLKKVRGIGLHSRLEIRDFLGELGLLRDIWHAPTLNPPRRNRTV